MNYTEYKISDTNIQNLFSTSTKNVALEIFRMQQKPGYRNQVFFIFQNISRTTNFLKNHGHSFLSSIKKIVPSKKLKERNMIFVGAGAGQKFYSFAQKS